MSGLVEQQDSSEVLTFESMSDVQRRAVDKAALRAGVEGAVEQACVNVVNAAAPHIARAARIAEIRAIADWLDAEADRDFLDSDQRPYAADQLRERADEMEREHP